MGLQTSSYIHTQAASTIARYMQLLRGSVHVAGLGVIISVLVGLALVVALCAIRQLALTVQKVW